VMMMVVRRTKIGATTNARAAAAGMNHPFVMSL
jgi:hypothetical protein